MDVKEQSDLKSYNATEDSSQNEQFEKPPPGVGTWISVRFSVAYLIFLGLGNLYAMRVNLSVAILSMVNSTYLQSTYNNYSNCPKEPTQHEHTIGNRGEFNWNSHERSFVLGAFFYGYLITQIPGGYLAARYGGKSLFGFGVLCTAILTLFTPIAAQTSIALLFTVRFFEGVGEGVTFPAVNSMLGVWAPPIERTRFVSIAYGGLHFGTVLALTLSGLLSSSNIMGGWPSVFYIFGGVAILWCCIWFSCVTNYPRQMKRMPAKELIYIESNVKQNIDSVIPWKEIFLSKAVWAINIAHFSNHWGHYTLLTSLPMYMRDVLKYDTAQSGFMAALPYMVMCISQNITAILADSLRENKKLNTTQTRKIFNTVSFLGAAIFLVAVGYVGCDNVLAISFVCIASAFIGFGYSGYHSNLIEIASRYSGIIMGITNTIGSIPGFLSPAIVGILTNEKSNRGNWMYVFYIAAAIYVLGAIGFAVLGTGVEQDWNRDLSTTPEKNENDSLINNADQTFCEY